MAIVRDLESPDVGISVFDRFNAGREGTLRYYHSLCEVFLTRGAATGRALDAAVARMHAHAGEPRSGLRAALPPDSAH